VGLVQREIEAAGITTITLSGIADLTASVSAPRVAAIGYPLGRPFGQPGDQEGQGAVLRATLRALEEMDAPGSIRHLPFEWPEPPREARSHPPEPPPIAKYLRRHPWHLPRLLRRDIPT
jgi:D-proline reductase (dithiol) PrdB